MEHNCTNIHSYNFILGPRFLFTYFAAHRWLFCCVFIWQGIQRSLTSVFCQTSPLCPLEWTLDNSPLSHQTTGRITEALRNSGGSKFSCTVFALLSHSPTVSVSAPLSIFSSHTHQFFRLSPGSVAASQAALPRVTTLSWPSSRGEALELQLDPDWPVQGTRGTKTQLHSQSHLSNNMNYKL